MPQSGRIAFGAMEAVVFGRPAADAILEEVSRLGAERVFLMASGAGADLLVTIGGGSVTDGGKAVQLCLANDIRTPEALDAFPPGKRTGRCPRAAALRPALGAADHGADDIVGRRIQRHRRRHRRAAPG